jgi:Ca-activated chloride channel family protein
MSDPLDDLKHLMDQATPTPDPLKKAADLRAAEKIFDDLQGQAQQPRLTSDRPRWAGFTSGVRKMIATLTSRQGLTATTALVAIGLVAVIPALRTAPPPDMPLVLEPAPAMDEEIALADTLAPEPMVISEAAVAPPSPKTRAAPLNMAPVAGLTQPDLAVPPMPEINTERFANEEESALKITAESPVSTFSVDVDTASYALMRQSIMNGTLPPRDAIRVEELINYFPYDYPAPTDAPFQPTVTVAPTPWNADTQLMHIAIQGQQVTQRPPLNLVFLIDTSGSMDAPNKLPLLIQSFRLMLGQLDAEDQVSIVTYAGSAGRVLDPTPASDRATILAALDNLRAGGSTAGQAGLQQAYATAAEMADQGEVSRMILATDGDFNVGLSDSQALEDFIAQQRDGGTYLSVLGFGRGNLNDAAMQALAQNGNGTAAYIDTLSEAQKVLVDQLSGALFPIANDVKIQVEFNPATVAEYRLIGYETRALNRADFNNDRVDAGEIGAGHTVTAVYEITPVGSPAQLSDPLRYANEERPEGSDEIAFLRLRYKAPGEEISQLIEQPITPDMAATTTETRFAAAIAGFGQLLRGSDQLGDWSFEDAATLAAANTGADPFGYRREAIQLIRLAESLTQ